MLRNARSHNSVDIQPLGPSLNPVTPAAISSWQSNQVSLKTDTVFPSERGKDRTFPGLFFHASPTRRRLLLIVIRPLSPSHPAVGSDDDGVSEQAAKNIS